MSLTGLFTDRKVRKLIKESVYNAEEIVNSECSCCHRSCNTLKLGNYNICESCASVLEGLSEDYERAFESSYMEIDTIIKEELINEAICKIGNFQKLKDDTNNKYGGDLAKLFKAYEIQKPYNCGSIIPKNYQELELLPADLTGGKSKVNRFIDDFDIQLSTRAKNSLVPDPDGYISKSVGITNNSTSTATSVSQPSKPTVKGATNAKPVKAKGPGFSVQGDENKFSIKIADDISVECVLDTANLMGGGFNTYNTKLEGTNEKPYAYAVKQSDVKSMAKDILDKIKEVPSNVFTSFNDDFDSTKGYILSDYPEYSFMFDDDSFDGKSLTLVLTLNGKPYNTRIQLSMRDIISKAALDGKLLKAMQNRLSTFYPVLFDGSMNIQTSLGRAISEFVSVDNSNTVKVHTELGNNAFEWEIPGNNLKEKELSINSMLDAVYAKLDKLIPEWSLQSLRDKKKVKNFTDCFRILTDPSFDVYLNFSLEELYETHNFVFHMSVIDKSSGIEQPKKFEPIVYNRPGVRLSDFAISNGEKIYKKYFSKSDMVDTITQSAQEKLKNRSKREVFLSYLADTLKRSLGNDMLKNLDLDIEEFDVNNEQKVTNVVFRVSDPFNEVAGTSDSLKDIIKLDKESWIKVVKTDDSPKSLKANGPSVIYKVTKIKDFSECVNLRVLESAMLEAFGLLTRKVISVNEEEAYWKEVDGEYVLVV